MEAIGRLINWNLTAVGSVLIALLIIVIRHGKLIRDLHSWHDVTDQDGVRIWYVRQKSLEEAIRSLKLTTEKQTELLGEMVSMMKSLDRDHGEMSKDLRAIHEDLRDCKD